MGIGQNAADDRKGGRKVFAANIEVKAASSTSCAFCWFVMGVYPSLSAMIEKDSDVYRLHLLKTHGLKPDIQA